MKQASFDPLPGSDEELARFGLVQCRLRERFLRFRGDHTLPYTTVVIPSQSVDQVELAKIEGVAHYEERFLFNLMLLRHPRLRVVFVTSKRLNPLVVDYYLHQMRGIPTAHARRRLVLLDCDDASPRALTEKILQRPRLIERISDAILDTNMAHMAVFNSTPLERTLAVQLEIPLYACDPSLVHLGSKTGSREVFRKAELPLPPGHEGLRDTDDLVDGVAELWEEVPDAQRVVVKLNESFSGEGNALLDLRKLPDCAPGNADARARRRAVRDALPSLRFEAKNTRWEEYQAQFEHMGGICELWLEGKGKTSPSAQLRINPLGEVQAVATHDQALGGPNGQVFEGASFPADRRYRLAIQEMGKKVGQVLADQGVIGRFGVDFIAVPAEEEGASPSLYAVEINLRSGGTTHPFNTLKFITDGRYDEETGVFYTAQGQQRSYYATDTLSAEDYRGMLPFDLINVLIVKGIHFRSDATGVVFHLFGCLSEFGKIGCTAIAPTVREAKAIYAETANLLDEMSGRGSESAPVL